VTELPDVDTTARLKALIADLFKCDPSRLGDDAGPGTVPGWDSLGHVTLIAAVQKEFGKEVPLEDAIAVESIADLVRVLDGV
jgi:acyl carrier protein